MLLQLRDAMKRLRVASSQQLARELRMDEQALQPMLAIWVKKGLIQPCLAPTGCASACRHPCKSNSIVFYQYRMTDGSPPTRG